MSHFSVKSLADRWSCSHGAIYELIRCGKLHAMNLTPGRKRATYRIPAQAVERYETEMSTNRSAGDGRVVEYV